jgi:hypothetical protein
MLFLLEYLKNIFIYNFYWKTYYKKMNFEIEKKRKKMWTIGLSANTVTWTSPGLLSPPSFLPMTSSPSHQHYPPSPFLAKCLLFAVRDRTRLPAIPSPRLRSGAPLRRRFSSCDFPLLPPRGIPVSSYLPPQRPLMLILAVNYSRINSSASISLYRVLIDTDSLLSSTI